MAPPPLTIAKVFGELKAVALTKGGQSMKAKKEKIVKMLVASKGVEAKYIVRMLQTKLRIGIQNATVLQSLSHAFVLSRPKTASNAVVGDVRAQKGWTPDKLEQAFVAMEAGVKRAYAELPNYGTITT